MRDPLRPETMGTPGARAVDGDRTIAAARAADENEAAATDPVSVGLVGTGYFARFHARAWQRLPGVALSGVVAETREAGLAFCAELSGGSAGGARDDASSNAAHGPSDDAAGTDPAKAPPASRVYVHDSIIALAAHEAPDIVDIVTPPETHAALIRECLIAGVPTVICQKPFCRDLAEAEALVADIDASATTVVVHENFRFQPWYREIRTLLDAQALGEVYQLRFALRPGDGQGEDAYLDRQPYFRTQPQFLIRETGVHFIDVFRYLLGEVEGLFARLARLNPVITGEDAGTVLFEFDNGVRATLDGNRLADHAAADPRLVMGELVIEGSAATLALSGDGTLRLRRHGEQYWTPHVYRFDDVDFGGDCVRLCCAHVVAHLRHGEPLVNTATDYLTNRRIENAIYRSHEAGRWLDVRDWNTTT